MHVSFVATEPMKKYNGPSKGRRGVVEEALPRRGVQEDADDDREAVRHGKQEEEPQKRPLVMALELEEEPQNPLLSAEERAKQRQDEIVSAFLIGGATVAACIGIYFLVKWTLKKEVLEVAEEMIPKSSV